MNDYYYCKNCNYVVGKYTKFGIYIFCEFIESENFDSIFFLDCKNCDKFVGILCSYVCKNCFGKKQIFGEEILFDWFLKYMKIRNFNYFCKKCGMDEFRNQYWFFEELTFHKK